MTEPEYDYGTPTEPTGDLLTRLRTSVAEMLELQAHAAKLEEEAKATKRALDNITITVIPALLAKAGIDSFKTSDGQTVGLKDVVYARITDENYDEAMAWLKVNGHIDIVSTELKLKFTKGNVGAAEEAMERVRALGYEPEEKQVVNTNTLQALLKDELKKGAEVPLETFNASWNQVAYVKQTRKRALVDD